ncbi:MAG: DMT family transporter [Bacteroidota bacterium]
MKSQFMMLVIALLAGAVLPLQAGLNIQLGKAVHQPIFAAFASFLVGTVALFIYLVLLKFDFSTMNSVKSVSPVVWTAGVLGAFYVAVVIILAPKLGVAMTFVLIVAGQMAVSVFLDHYGLMGMPIKKINIPRILEIVCLIAGVLLIRKF